jgi:glycosyltransferase involved in cell wall biosynthesis
MANEAIVDVGIPTFGEPTHLHEAVESVMSQTFADWRLTISENGAGDAAIAASLRPYVSDSRVRHVIVGSDVTGGENATNALQAGSAPYVSVLHDDDRWDAEFLARRVAFLEQHSTCGFVFANGRLIDSRGREFFRIKVPLEGGLQDRRAFLRGLYLRNFVPVQSVLGRRSAYDTVGPTFSSILFDDHEMWMRIAAHFDIGFIDVCDSDYRVHEGQKSHTAFAQLGYHRLEFYESVDAWIPSYVTRRDRKRAHASAYLREALEAKELGQHRRALATLVQGLREYPMALLDWPLASLAFSALRTRSRLRRAWSETDPVERGQLAERR